MRENLPEAVRSAYNGMRFIKPCSTDFLLEADISVADQKRTAHGSAERLLHLGS